MVVLRPDVDTHTFALLIITYRLILASLIMIKTILENLLPVLCNPDNRGDRKWMWQIL